MKTLLVVLVGLAVAQACEDLTLFDGQPWHDNGGEQYNCADHYANGKCARDGGKAKFAYQGMRGNDACCACGGGTTGEFSLNGGSAVDPNKGCVVDTNWKHPEFGDYCADYEKNGRANKWRCKDELAVQPCCHLDCQSKSAGECTPEEGWTHPSYGESCADYDEGGSAEQYACDALAKEKCCTCQEAAVQDNCADLTTDNGGKWSDSGGYDCAYYAGGKGNRCYKYGHKYENFGMVANEACCVCGGGGENLCEDMTMANGDPWHDEAGPAYGCEYYSSNNRCIKHGMKFANEEGVNAKLACCVCGGGIKGGMEGLEDIEPPKPDEGDDIEYEWLGNTKYSHKKHMQNGFILYWKVDVDTEILSVGVLSPPDMGQHDWLSVGFSPTGMMADSDAVVGYFDKVTGGQIITDYYFENQSPNGIKKLQRQNVAKAGLFWHANNRIALTYERPWTPVAGGIELKLQSSFIEVIYARGKTNKVCMPHGFCNHIYEERGSATLALTVPAGMSVYELNKGMVGEPCNGPAQLECYEGFTCYHPDAWDGDYFKPDFEHYGECVDPADIGDETDLEAEVSEWDDVPQAVFPGGGGFQNSTMLPGGFTVLWTVDRTSQPGSFHPDDSITIAFISTRPDNQGWIGCGFSPNGEMKGSDVVIGWRDSEDAENFHLGDYFLEAQVASMNTEANKQNLEYAQVIKKNGQTCLTFTRKITPADSVQVLEGEVHWIYAHGPMPDVEDKQYIPYHRFRNERKVEFMKEPEEIGMNNAGMMELCAGEASIKCKKSYVCNMFTEDMLTRWVESRQSNETDRWQNRNMTGYTSAAADSGFHGSRNNRTNIWMRGPEEIMELLGSGMCVTEEMGARWNMSSFNYTEFRSSKALNEDEWPNKLELRWGFFLYWKVEEPNIKIALVADSHRGGWIGFGLGAGGYMIGANAVIGWSDRDDESNTKVGEYYLQNKLPWEIMPLQPGDPASMGATDVQVIVKGIQNAIVFTRPLVPDSGMAPIVPGPIDVIFASGNTPLPVDDYFGYHRFRDTRKVTFIPLDIGEEAEKNN